MSESAEMELVAPGRLGFRTLIISLLGILGCVALGWWLIGPAIRRLTVWVPTTCSIQSTRVGETEGSFNYSSGGDDHGRGATQHTVSYVEFSPLVTFDYAVNGQTYHCEAFDALRSGQICQGLLDAERTAATARHRAIDGTEPEPLERLLAIPPKYSRAKVEAILENFRPETDVGCWIDPAAPSHVALLRRLEWFHVAVAALLAYGVLAFLADVYLATRRQYRAPKLYTVPLSTRGQNATPGSRGLAFLGVGGIVLFISIFVYIDYFMWLIGDWPILITLIVLPFALLALIVIFSAVWDLFTLGVGPVLAEVETGDLKPFDRVRTRVVQQGPANLTRFSIWLVVAAKASKRSGKRGGSGSTPPPAYEKELTTPVSVRLRAGRYFEQTFDLDIPEVSGGSRLQWSLVVRRRKLFVPMLSETFALPMLRQDR